MLQVAKDRILKAPDKIQAKREIADIIDTLIEKEDVYHWQIEQFINDLHTILEKESTEYNDKRVYNNIQEALRIVNRYKINIASSC